MYNLLETQLQNLIVVPKELTVQNFRERLKGVVITKVKGPATLDDYTRLNSFVENLNQLAESIAVLVMVSDEFQATIQQAEEALRNAQGAQKNALREELKNLKDPKLLAKQMGWGDDERGLKALREFLDLLYIDAMKITITPTSLR